MPLATVPLPTQCCPFCRLPRRCTRAILWLPLFRAQGGAELLLERGDDPVSEAGKLRFGEGGFAALERDAHQQRILASGDLPPAEQVDGLDVRHFGDGERADCFNDLGKARALSEKQRKIALDRRETRQRIVSERLASPKGPPIDPVRP